jgi:PAS domain S-box-containing protein
LAAIVESSEDAIVGKDINGIITSWNKGAEKIFGYSASEIVGTSIIRLIPADRRDEEEHILGQIRAGRSVRDFETVRQTQDGQLIDVSVTASPILNATGKTIGISKVARDITERRQAEKKLQKSEDMFGKAFRNSPLAISITTEKEGRYVDINEAFLRTFGYERQEVIGRTSSELGFFWPDAEKRNEMFRHLAKDGRLTGFRLQGQTSKQETLQLEVFAELIDLEEDRCLLAITRDITESLRLETQSRQVQKMDAVGLLAGGVAHDFNNLLGVIMGYSDLVLEASPRDDLRYRQVQQIRKASERAISLTRQLLAFSRKQIFQPKILDINALVTEFSKMLRRMVDENVELVSCLDRSLGHIKADPGQIEQVIMNLVVNARDAMPSGGRVTIETSNAYLDDTYCQAHPVAQPGRYVVVAVSDTGMGMNDKTQARIFEPFFTTKEQGKGTGLGLATVYGVVKQSGGYVWVYSELGKGTTFKMYFPRVDGLSEPSETSNDGKNKIKRGSETILLVEDADLLRTLTCTLLENNGYIVFVAVNGVDAIKLSESEARTIHLLLTDVVMPGMSGPELANYLTAKRPDLRVIYMSGYTNDTITNQGVLDPGINFIEKPFSQEALMSEVRAVLDRPEKVVA